MKHNIEPIINQYFSCHQILLATYASYQKRDYEMIFAESWGFKYEKDDHNFGTSLHPGYQNRRKLLFEKFHGIKIKEVQYTNRKNLIDLIKSILPYSPIILYHNAYNCPWNISYRRNRIDHYILINGIDERIGCLYVLDPFSTKDENTIDINSVGQDNGSIYIFETMQINPLQTKEYHAEITNTLNHMENTKFFHNLSNFYDDFQDCFEEVVMSEYTDIYAIPLILNLSRISYQRHCYCIFLNKMVEKDLIDSLV